MPPMLESDRLSAFSVLWRVPAETRGTGTGQVCAEWSAVGRSSNEVGVGWGWGVQHRAGSQMADKQEAAYYRTVSEMRAVPADKIDNFCEDLRLWLHMHKQVDDIRAALGPLEHVVQVTSADDAFGWVDDNKHDARIHIELHEVPAVENV